MTTGVDLLKHIKDGIDQEYSGFLNTDRANRLIRDCEIKVAEKHYSTSKTQKQSDELSPLTLLDQSITVKSNSFRTEPLRIFALTVVGTTATLTLEQNHQLSIGDALTLADTQGFTPSLDGTYTVISVPSALQVTFTVPVVAGTWTQGSGGVTHAYMFPELLHPLAIETTFAENKTFEINETTVAADPYISFLLHNSIRTGSKIRISGALGVTGLNGDFYVRQRNLTSYFLFTDSALLVPAVISGTYQGSGTVKMVVSEYATRLHSDRRISASTRNSDMWTPKYGVDSNAIKLYPDNAVCETVKVDYMRDPFVTINVADTSVDLENYYTFKYIMRIKNECVLSFMLEMRELQQTQAEAAVNTANP